MTQIAEIEDNAQHLHCNIMAADDLVTTKFDVWIFHFQVHDILLRPTEQDIWRIYDSVEGILRLKHILISMN